MSTVEIDTEAIEPEVSETDEFETVTVPFEQPESSEQEPDGETQAESSQVNPAEIVTDEQSERLEAIYAAEIICRNKEAAVEEIKEELKEAKASLEQAVMSLRKLAIGVHDKNRPLFTQSTKSQQAGESDAGQGDDDADAGDSNAWRDEPINGIFAGIKGLGKKKLETLLELCPTAGKFEDLRGEASRAYKEFREVLPKGFGQSTADEMEERFLNWLQRYQVASVPVEPSGDGGASETEETTESQADIEARQDQLDTRANELGDGDLNSQHEDGCKYHEEGKATEFLYSCPYPPGEKQDDWIRGWLLQVEEGGEVDPAEVDATETESKPVEIDAELAEL